MGFTRNKLDQTYEQLLEVLYVRCKMNVEVMQYQTVLLIVHVSYWQTILFLPLSPRPPKKYSLQHFELYERNFALRNFEMKLFGRTNTRKWVMLNISGFFAKYCITVVAIILHLVLVSSYLQSFRQKIQMTQFFSSSWL